METFKEVTKQIISGRRDSNPLQKLGRLLCYRYTTPAKVKHVWLSVANKGWILMFLLASRSKVQLMRGTLAT